MKSSLLILTLIFSLAHDVSCQEKAISNDDEIFAEIRFKSIKHLNSQKALYNEFLNTIESKIYSNETKSRLTANLFPITSLMVPFFTFQNAFEKHGAILENNSILYRYWNTFHWSIMRNS